MNKNPKGKNQLAKPTKKPVLKVQIKPPEKDLSAKISRKSTPPTEKTLNKKVSKDSGLGSESFDLSNDRDLDSARIAETTDSLKTQLMDCLQVFKNASSEYIEQNFEMQKEVDQLQKGVGIVKSEVSSLLWESYKSKEELGKMKSVIGTPMSRGKDREMLEIDLSSVEESEDGELMNSLRTLQDEIMKIKEKIENNESELKNKETQNSDLRSAILRLRDSITTTPTPDTSKNPCCLLF